MPRWSNVLRDLLRRALPACNVRVHMGLDDSARETTYGMRITTAATPLVISRLMSARDDLAHIRAYDYCRRLRDFCAPYDVVATAAANQWSEQQLERHIQQQHKRRRQENAPNVRAATGAH